MKLEGIAPCNLGGGGKSNRLPAVTQRSPSVRFHVLRRPLRLTGRRLMEGPQRVRPAGALASARRQAVPAAGRPGGSCAGRVESERIDKQRIEEGEFGVTKLPPSPTLPSPKPRSTTAGFFLFCGVGRGCRITGFSRTSSTNGLVFTIATSAFAKARSVRAVWHGAYTTYEEARRTAAEMSPKKGAQLIAAFDTRKTSRTIWHARFALGAR
jgi:hypothetical protein